MKQFRLGLIFHTEVIIMKQNNMLFLCNEYHLLFDDKMAKILLFYFGVALDSLVSVFLYIWSCDTQ